MRLFSFLQSCVRKMRPESAVRLDHGRPLRIYAEDGRFADFGTDEVFARGENRFQGWSCSAGVTSLYIAWNGEVFGASCRIGGSYGNIFKNLQLPKEWVTCERRACVCGSDLFIPKAQTPERRELLRLHQGKITEFLKREPLIRKGVAVERTFHADCKQVEWNLGRRCNYSCSYCASDVHNKTDRHYTKEELFEAADRLMREFAGPAKMFLTISGGEPTLNPATLDWVKYIHSFGHHLSMTSNGTRLPQYYRELIHFCNLNLSFHFESADRDKFVRVVEAIVDEMRLHPLRKIGHLEVKAMMAPGDRLRAAELYERVRGIPGALDLLTFSFVPVRTMEGDDLLPGYDAEDLKLLNGA